MYDRSFEVLRELKQGGKLIKSGLKLRLGESESEVVKANSDLRIGGVGALTLGWYHQPRWKRLPVFPFLTPERFLEDKEIGIESGYRYLDSGTLVRSTYHAEATCFEMYRI